MQRDDASWDQSHAQAVECVLPHPNPESEGRGTRCHRTHIFLVFVLYLFSRLLVVCVLFTTSTRSLLLEDNVREPRRENAL